MIAILMLSNASVAYADVRGWDTMRVMQWSIVVCLAVFGWMECAQPNRVLKDNIVDVASTDGLSSLTRRSANGSSMQALELIYENLVEHAVLSPLTNSPDETRITIKMHEFSPYDANMACKHLLVRQPSMEVEVDNDACILKFQNAAERHTYQKQQQILFHKRHFCIDTEHPVSAGSTSSIGQNDEFAIAKAELSVCAEAESSVSIEGIHIAEMSLREAWRRLLARNIDVLPSIPWLYRKRFVDLDSVRVADIPVSSYISMLFDVRQSAWADVRVRRRVASLIDPQAIAAVACGEPSCAVTAWQRAEPETGVAHGDAEVALPPKIVIQALATRTQMVAAARAMSYWLRRQSNAEVTVETYSIEQLIAHFREPPAADAPAMIRILPLRLPRDITTPAEFGLLQQSLSFMSGYRSDAYDKAHAAADKVAIKQVLERDVPMIPLYALRQFAVIDNRFCGSKPERATSWRWIGKLRPCSDEDAP